MNDLNDYDRGEYDRIAGYDALPNQSDSYEQGYGKAYNLVSMQYLHLHQRINNKAYHPKNILIQEKNFVTT